MMLAIINGRWRWTCLVALSLGLHALAGVVVATRQPREGAAGATPVAFTLVDTPVAARAERRSERSHAPERAPARRERLAVRAPQTPLTQPAATATAANDDDDDGTRVTLPRGSARSTREAELPTREAGPANSLAREIGAAKPSAHEIGTADAATGETAAAVAVKPAVEVAHAVAADAVAPAEPAAAARVPASAAAATRTAGVASGHAGDHGSGAASDRLARPPWVMPDSCTDGLDYPASAMSRGKEGVVRMLVSLDEHGDVVQAKVTGSVGFGLDEAALDAVRTRCRFSPARNGRGQPVPALVEHLFSFRIADFR
jgi:TonB family protein